MSRRRKPIVRIGHREAGWLMRDATDFEPCTTNFLDGQVACIQLAVWRVVEDHGMHLTIGYWCDGDLPAEHRPQAGVTA